MKTSKTSIPEDVNEGLDIIHVFQLFWRHKTIILLCSLLVAVLFFVRTVYFVDNTYTAEGLLYVSNRVDNNTQSEDRVIQKSDIDTSRTLGITFIEILKTRDFLEEISKRFDYMISWRDIGNMLSVTAVNETELLRISVTSKNPKLAYHVADAVLNAAPEKMLGIYEGGKVEIVNSVHIPSKANSKGTAKHTAVGFIIGAMLGIMYAFIRNLLDKRIKSSAEIEQKYGVSILGEVSNISPANNRRHSVCDENPVLTDQSSFHTIETYKSIRTNIAFSIAKSDRGKIVTVTSAAPNEGKTTTSINLAITFAQTNAKVLLIDCDLRKSTIHRYLQIECGEGISNVLCGFCDLEKAIKKTPYDNFDLLTAGEIPPNPAELLESEEFGKVLTVLQGTYDYIFIDTPPVTVVTDAMLVMQKSNGVVVVTRENQTTYDLMDKTMENIDKTGTKVLGVIVSGSAEKQKKYGYYKYEEYGYMDMGQKQHLEMEEEAQ